MAERNENKGNTPNQGTRAGNQGTQAENSGHQRGDQKDQQRTSGSDAGRTRGENDKEERTPQAGNRPVGDATRTQAGPGQERGGKKAGGPDDQDR